MTQTMMTEEIKNKLRAKMTKNKITDGMVAKAINKVTPEKKVSRATINATFNQNVGCDDERLSLISTIIDKLIKAKKESEKTYERVLSA